MIHFLLDSDITIDFEGGVPSTRMLVEPLLADGAAISVISFMEVYQGLLRLPESEPAKAGLGEFLEGVDVLPVTLDIARRCAEIRAELQRRGKSVRSRALDLLIAATSIEHRLILVTRNVADYSDVPGLQLMTALGSGLTTD